MSSIVSAGSNFLQRIWTVVRGSRTHTIVLSVTVGVAVTVVIYTFTRRRSSPTGRNVNSGNRQIMDSRPYGQHSQQQQQQQRGSSGAPFIRQESMRTSLRHRNSPSTCTNDGRTSATPASNEQLLLAGFENLIDTIRQWDVIATANADTASSPRSQPPVSDAQLKAQLADLLLKARSLRRDASQLMGHYGVDAADTACTSPMVEFAAPPTAGSIRRGTLSVLSDDSFQSALEELIPDLGDLDITLRAPLKLSFSQLKFYHEGLTAAKQGKVDCRVVRTEAVGCTSDEEFLAKLYCVRRAFEVMLTESDKRKTMADAGRRMIGGLLKQARKEVQPFYEAYDKMMAYLKEPNVWSSIVEELKPRRVCALSFYDIVLDFVLMDAFDDLAQPPSAVFAVTRNRYLSDNLKESTLKTIIWSVLKGKRNRLPNHNGFISRFYDISEVVSPVLAWGFLGTDERLRELCYYFKEQISSFLVDIFHFDRCRYTTVNELAEDIWVFCQTRAELIENRLNSELLPPET